MKKIIFILSLLCIPLIPLKAQLPTYYLETIKTCNDNRIELLMKSGFFTALAAVTLKCILWHNWYNNNVLIKDATIKKLSFYDRIMPSSSTLLLLNGLFLIIFSKTIINFLDGFYTSWAFNKLNPDLQADIIKRFLINFQICNSNQLKVAFS